MPRVSIIMPTYNRAWVISRAIDSVLAQTDGDYELLIMDDGSTDATHELLTSYSDPRIRVHRLDHRGASRARNVALKEARGELIAYLDSDDTYEPDFLRIMVAELHPQHLLAYCGQQLYLVTEEAPDAQIIARRIRSQPYNPVTLTYSNYIGINSVVHRREVISLIGGFDESLHTFEDWDFLSRLAIDHPFRIKHVDQVLSTVYYFTRTASPTTTNAYADDTRIAALFGIRGSEQEETEILQRIEQRLAQSGNGRALGAVAQSRSWLRPGSVSRAWRGFRGASGADGPEHQH